MSEGFINFSILNAEELTEEEEVSMRHSSSIRVLSDREEEGEETSMAPKIDKALLAQRKAEKAKQSVGATRKSSRLQKELNVDSFLDANLSSDPTPDTVIEKTTEEEAQEVEKTKRKAKGLVFEEASSTKKAKASAGPLVLGGSQKALEWVSGLLSVANKDLMAEMSLQAVGEQMLVAAHGRYLTSQSHSLGKQVVTLIEANMKLTKEGTTMRAELKKVTGERDTALQSKRGLEEERDVIVATAKSLDQKILEWNDELEKYKTMSMRMIEKVKNARREAISLFLKYPEYHQDITQHYFDGFKAMRSRATLAYLDLDFSKFEVMMMRGRRSS
ncbi:hypothetical protein RHMOL_Rhmol04G0192500 [Rhododendron molle]|uniref:Uncharacterized protein n=1 Tax=Rhododendron molle TaxID=49168 RepID=A0ACC0P392_RHOML|nr:hypothetical protein RHMOL_Rhmol04G0192500 [Rhododendron molle]